jgi:nicotinate (nicotinamide) nucleotide adenylyltransferase
MEFFQRAERRPRRLAVFPGAFNPVTVAHMALAEAALTVTDEVLFVLPRTFPHKTYSGASFGQRVQLLCQAVHGRDNFSIAASCRGLFVEIAEECREAYGDIRLSFLCGRDAAERIAHWDYGDPRAFEAMLRQFDFLVAARAGEYSPPEHQRGSFTPLPLDNLDHVSATEIRARIVRGEAWEHLVPGTVQKLVREIYTNAALTATEDSD